MTALCFAHKSSVKASSEAKRAFSSQLYLHISGNRLNEGRLTLVGVKEDVAEARWFPREAL